MVEAEHLVLALLARWAKQPAPHFELSVANGAPHAIRVLRPIVRDLEQDASHIEWDGYYEIEHVEGTLMIAQSHPSRCMALPPLYD